MPTCNGRGYCVVAILLLAWPRAVLVRQPPSPPLTRQIRFNPPQLDLGAIPRMAPTASKVNPDPLTCPLQDRKSTRLNSSHSQISYAVFCLKKKKNYTPPADTTTP